MMKATIPMAAPRPPRPTKLRIAPLMIPAKIANSPPIIQRIPIIVTPNGLSDIPFHSSGCTYVLLFERNEKDRESHERVTNYQLIRGRVHD
jgi:hypothetical protein